MGKLSDFDVGTFLAAVNSEKEKIAAARDRLRELADEAGELQDACDDALDSLGYATDVLSGLV